MFVSSFSLQIIWRVKRFVRLYVVTKRDQKRDRNAMLELFETIMRKNHHSYFSQFQFLIGPQQKALVSNVTWSFKLPSEPH